MQVSERVGRHRSAGLQVSERVGRHCSAGLQVSERVARHLSAGLQVSEHGESLIPPKNLTEFAPKYIVSRNAGVFHEKSSQVARWEPAQPVGVPATAGSFQPLTALKAELQMP